MKPSTPKSSSIRRFVKVWLSKNELGAPPYILEGAITDGPPPPFILNFSERDLGITILFNVYD
jgi:hypothetical protein